MTLTFVLSRRTAGDARPTRLFEQGNAGRARITAVRGGRHSRPDLAVRHQI